MSHRTPFPAPTATDPAPVHRRVRRNVRLRRLTAALAAAATVATIAGTAAPAYAGIPDAGQPDYLRTPAWTSIAMNPTGPGYWTQVDAVGSRGGHTVTAGGAPDVGSFNDDGGYIRATPSGQGFIVIQEDGSMHAYGDATGFSVPANISDASGWEMNNGDGIFYNPIVGMALTPDGRGGWALDATGQVWPWGDAHYHGQPSHNEVGDAVDIVATSTGNGYTILTNAGDVYDYGDAAFYGHPKFSSGTMPGIEQATGIALTPNDKGYWIVDSWGVVHPYGNATNLGNNPEPNNSFAKLTTDIAALPAGNGYALITDDGSVSTYTSNADLSQESITSASSTVFFAGHQNRFDVETTPGVRKISVQGRLPKGVRFSADDRGNASLTGVPRKRTARSLTFVARAADGTVVQRQDFTLRVVAR